MSGLYENVVIVYADGVHSDVWLSVDLYIRVHFSVWVFYGRQVSVFKMLSESN